MNQDLENKLNENGKMNFRSKAEKQIAYFLDNNGIKYRYEQALIVNDENNKQRIWYPDFYLPEYGVYLEYYGLAGQKDYDIGIKRKESAYRKTGIDVIPIYPWVLKENWKGYVMQELERSVLKKYKKLKTRPYWHLNNTGSYGKVLSFSGYSRRSRYK
jgi:DNA helicase-4